MNRLLRMLVASAAFLATSAGAVVVSYYPSDLADVVQGEDRWSYRYQIDEFPFDAGYGFAVYFDPDLYADLLASPAAPDPDWDAVAFDPDPNLGDDGFYDAEALIDAPSVDVAFTVTFRWLGSGTPGAQSFEVRDPSFAVVPGETGTTVLPEPASLLAGVTAVAALSARRRMLS